MRTFLYASHVAVDHAEDVLVERCDQRAVNAQLPTYLLDDLDSEEAQLELVGYASSQLGAA